MNARDIFLVMSGLYVIYIFLHMPKMRWVTASNGKAYYVKNVSDAPAAAELLSALEGTIRAFCDAAKALAPDCPHFAVIRRRWDGTLSEIEPGRDDHTIAYSLGKRSIHLCVRTATGEIEDRNTAMFILIHELAHVATEHEIGHTPSFWKTHKYLLELAERVGAYRHENHDDQRVNYCKRPLGRSPLECVKDGMCESSLAHLTPAPAKL
jgi:hypothetical protein